MKSDQVIKMCAYFFLFQLKIEEICIVKRDFTELTQSNIARSSSFERTVTLSPSSSSSNKFKKQKKYCKNLFEKVSVLINFRNVMYQENLLCAAIEIAVQSSKFETK